MLARSLSLTVVTLLSLQAAHAADPLALSLRYQTPVTEAGEAFHVRHRGETWQADKTAIIICDMWDSHHCVNAVRRVAEIAPRIDALANHLRIAGSTVIHAPSSCMDFYADQPARLRATRVSIAKELPDNIESWCDQIPNEESFAYPIDQSDGGEDDAPAEHASWAARLAADGKNPGSPWTRQTGTITIDDDKDFISDDGRVIWSILQQRGIENVILVGVHTNMCVLGRPFGLRRLAASGMNVVLCRDLTDTMYNPAAWPYASHFTGTDLIVSHVERHVCPTITSNQILSGQEHKFLGDTRPHLVVMIAEAEYATKDTLPVFAAAHLSRDYRVTFLYADSDDKNTILNASAIDSADALLISVRRRALPAADLKRIRHFVAAGKPVIGIRTASHAFSLRKEAPPAGHAVWPDFDARVWGGAYDGHYGNTLKASLKILESTAPIDASDLAGLRPGGSLYKNVPLQAGATAILSGAVESGPQHPLAWTYIRSDGGKSFYTSLGHVDDFRQAEFRALLLRGIHWACGIDSAADLQTVEQQSARYLAGKGKQR